MLPSWSIFIVVILVTYPILNVLGFFPWSALYGAWPWQKKDR